MREVRPLIGGEEKERYRRATRLSLIPYFGGGILMCVAGALNPKGMMLILISAAASTFGGTSGLLWATSWLRGGKIIPHKPPAEGLPIQRSWPLATAAAAASLAFVLFVGRSIRFVH
jgi:hypothetical protein